MAVTKLGANRYRAQTYYRGKNIDVSAILGGSSIFTRKADATAAVHKARERLKANKGIEVTLGSWADRWRSDPMWQRPKDSTNLRYAYVVEEFVSAYGHLPIRQIDHRQISEYLASGNKGYRVAPLKAMFSDAMSTEAGRLLDVNPWMGVKIRKPVKDVESLPHPPSEEKVREIIAAASLYGPSLQAWLQVACFTGMRPGELDGLKWECVHFEDSRISVDRQFNNFSKKLTLPKNGRTRKAIMTAPARDALLSVRGLHPVFVFPGIRAEHLRESSRTRPWNRIREQVGWSDTLYMATRHFAGWWMYSVMLLDAEDVGMALGHKDGQLVRQRYGHRNVEQALDRVAAAAARYEHATIPAHRLHTNRLGMAV